MKKHLLIYTWKLLRSGSVSIRFYGNLRFEKVTFFCTLQQLHANMYLKRLWNLSSTWKYTLFSMRHLIWMFHEIFSSCEDVLVTLLEKVKNKLFRLSSRRRFYSHHEVVKIMIFCQIVKAFCGESVKFLWLGLY